MSGAPRKGGGVRLAYPNAARCRQREIEVRLLRFLPAAFWLGPSLCLLALDTARGLTSLVYLDLLCGFIFSACLYIVYFQ